MGLEGFGGEGTRHLGLEKRRKSNKRALHAAAKKKNRNAHSRGGTIWKKNQPSGPTERRPKGGDEMKETGAAPGAKAFRKKGTWKGKPSFVLNKENEFTVSC